MSEICETLGISDLNENDIPVGSIKQAVFDHHYIELKEEISKCKKMSNYKEDDFRKTQNYMNGKSIETTRLTFRVRCEMEILSQNLEGKEENRRYSVQTVLAVRFRHRVIAWYVHTGRT